MRNLRLDGSSSFIRNKLLENCVIIGIGNKQNIEVVHHVACFMNSIDYNGFGRQTCTISDLNVNLGVKVYNDDEVKDYFILAYPDVKDFIPAVQKHILSLFRTFVPSRVVAEIIDEELDGLPQINGVEESILAVENLEGAFVEHFFSTYPNQKRSRIYSKSIKILEENSKLFDLDCLFISHPAAMTPLILKQFKGSHLHLFNAELKMEDVMQCFQRWKSGEAYQNMEYLYIELQSGRFEPEVTIQLEAKPWDPTKRPMNYDRSPKVFEWLTFKNMSEPLACEGLLDIERGDGRLASIHIDSDFLRVCVWKNSQLKMD